MTKAPEHIGDDELKQVLAYVTVIRDRMRMNNWDIMLMQDPCDEDAYGSMTSNDNHYVGCLRLSELWLQMDNEGKRNTIIHELIHLQHRDLSCHWESCVDKNSSVSSNEVLDWGGDFTMFLERFVSWTTGMLEEFMPAYPVKSKTVGRGIYVQPG